MKKIVWFLFVFLFISCEEKPKNIVSPCFNLNKNRCSTNENCTLKDARQYIIMTNGYNYGAGDISKMVKDIDPTIPLCFPKDTDASVWKEKGKIIRHISDHFVLLTDYYGTGYGIRNLPSTLKTEGWKWINDPSENFKDESEYDFYCGDGIIGFGEECDVGILGIRSSDCSKFGYYYFDYGNITCDASCHWDFSDCH